MKHKRIGGYSMSDQKFADIINTLALLTDGANGVLAEKGWPSAEHYWQYGVIEDARRFVQQYQNLLRPDVRKRFFSYTEGE